jgi:hypothetical protein
MDETKRKGGKAPDAGGAGGLTLETLPGMGPIRARALRKAGWDSIASLKKATVADLTAVPGITEIKARQLVEYLQQPASAPALPPQPTSRTRLKLTAETAAKAVSPEPTEGRASVTALQSLQSLAAETGRAADGLLKSSLASTLDEPLVRQLGKLISLTEHTAGIKKLGPKRCERAASSLRKIGEALAQIATAEKLGAKKQERIAEELRDGRRQLEKTIE